jgi:uncharacterized membrane protein YfcA
LTIFVGGFLGGLVQGIIGAGSGTMMLGALIYSGLDPKVAAATSGFQIFFIGASSLIQAYANSLITSTQIGWFLGLSFIPGGIFTFFLYRYLGNKENRNVVLIVCIISLVIVVGTFPSIFVSAHYYGWTSMLYVNVKGC